MVSRTTKQAARAYQKVYGVPYSEALRRVVEPHDSSLQGADAIGSAANRGLERPAPESGKPVSIDPSLPWEDNQAKLLAAGLDLERADARGRIHDRSRRRNEMMRWLDPESVPPTSNEHQPGDPLIFDLGTMELQNTGFNRSRIPAKWSPHEDASLTKSATLGVYHNDAQKGATAYLATLARNHLVGLRTFIVASDPDKYPKQDGIEFAHPDVVDKVVASTRKALPRALSVLSDHVEEQFFWYDPQVVIYDCPVRRNDEAAIQKLLQITPSTEMIVLFAACDRETERHPLDPIDGPLPEADVTVWLSTFYPSINPPRDAWAGRSEEEWICRRAAIRRSGAEYDWGSLLLPQVPYMPEPSGTS